MKLDSKLNVQYDYTIWLYHMIIPLNNVIIENITFAGLSFLILFWMICITYVSKMNNKIIILQTKQMLMILE